MPRRAVTFIQGGHYHIYNQGAARRSIFREERNYHYVLRLMEYIADSCNLTIAAYCLLPNHYHWLVRQDGEQPASLLPQRVFGSYSQAFNHAYRERGTLFQGRYQARFVDTDTYLRQLCCYIHANPVKHGIAASLDDWPFSNYHKWVSLRTGRMCDVEFVATYFGSPEQYAAHIQAYVADRAAWARFDGELAW